MEVRDNNKINSTKKENPKLPKRNQVKIKPPRSPMILQEGGDCGSSLDSFRHGLEEK